MISRPVQEPGHPRWLLVALVVVLGVPLFSSCISIAAALDRAGLAEYWTTPQVRDFAADFPAAWDATRKALVRLEYSEAVTREVDGVTGRITGPDYDVRLERRPEGITRVNVRIGHVHTTKHDRSSGVLLQEIATLLDPDVQIREWTQQIKVLSEEERDDDG